MPRLFLVPNLLNNEGKDLLPSYITDHLKHVRLFFVEEQKSCRRLLKDLDPGFLFNECRFFDLNEHTRPQEVKNYVSLLKKEDGAIISEAGCPCVADPGTDLVFLAHQDNIEIFPLIGPSSIILALMASGLSGQNFAFNGYLPKDREQRVQKIKVLEDRSYKEKQTQIFMETPYRNEHLLEDLLTYCSERTNLCIACDLTGPQQMIKTLSIQAWKNGLPAINRKPALFLLQKI